MILQTFANAWKRIKNQLGELFHPSELSKLAHETKFIQRSTSLLQGKDIVDLMSLASIGSKVVSLDDLCSSLREINPAADLTRQSLMERINNPNTVEFLKRVFQKTIEKGIEEIGKTVPPDLLQGFNHVWIEDCSECALNEVLQEEFKGSGGAGSKACVKIHLIYEMKQKNIHSVNLVDRRSPDQKLAKNNLDIIQKNDLVIRDLGFFDASVLKHLDKEQGFFLSRLPACVNVYLNRHDKNPTDLIGYINKKFPNDSNIDIEVFVTTEKLPCRLIAYRISQELADRRRRKAKESARKKGRTPKKESLIRLDFTLFITNVPEKIWSAEVIGTIYSLRWQIELIFKNWKSSLKINYLKGVNPHRIRCLLYGRLITIVLINMIYKLSYWFAQQIGREISLHKVVNWLKKEGRLRIIILKRLNLYFMKLLILEIPKTLCKDIRKRKTTESAINSATPFKDLYKQSFGDEKLKTS